MTETKDLVYGKPFLLPSVLTEIYPCDLGLSESSDHLGTYLYILSHYCPLIPITAPPMNSINPMNPYMAVSARLLAYSIHLPSQSPPDPAISTIPAIINIELKNVLIVPS